MNSRALPLAALALAALLVGCAETKQSVPAELAEFQSSADVEQVWRASLSGNSPRLRLGLGVAAAGDVVFAASHSGDVVALNRENGRRLWRTDTRLKLTGGPGVGDGLVVVGASHGDIVALEADSGAERWRTRVNSEVLAAPAVGSGTVLVRMVDGRLIALRATDGTQAWSIESEVPRLSLRGTSQPLIAGSFAVVGFDNGRVKAFQLSNGDTVWEVDVAPPTGRSELERLVDIDTALLERDNTIYVVAYQGKAAAIDRETGQSLWTSDVSSHSGLALDDDGIYVSTADGSVVKIRRRGGVEMWRQSAFARRRLSPPAVLGSLVAVADLQGYVHFMHRDSGALAARVRPLGTRVYARPVVTGDLLVMMDADGSIVALRLEAVGEAASGAVVTGTESRPDGSTRTRPGN